MAKGLKTGGREAGTPNKITREKREVLSTILDNEYLVLSELLEKLSPKDRIDAICKLSKFVVPPPKAKEEPVEQKKFIIEICEPRDPNRPPADETINFR